MKLIVLGSSSRGNGYILDNGKDAILLEAGIPFLEVKKALQFDISRIRALLVSHSHGDHAKYVCQYLDARIPAYVSGDIFPELATKYGSLVHSHAASKYEWTAMLEGRFKYMPLPMEHDVPCYGFVVSHPDMGSTFFATDTAFVPYCLDGIDHALIEANYDIGILNENLLAGAFTKTHRDRVIQSHMSISTCLEVLDSLRQNGNCFNVVLIHLSDDNSDEDAFVDQARKQTKAQVYAARPGMEIELSNGPY